VRELPSKLQVANMNWGLAREKQSALLRFAGGEIRAVVSDRYAALDDALVLQVVADVLDRAGFLRDTLVRATAVGTSTILRVTLPSEGVAVKVGDVIEYGLDIGNSGRCCSEADARRGRAQTSAAARREIGKRGASLVSLPVRMWRDVGQRQRLHATKFTRQPDAAAHQYCTPKRSFKLSISRSQASQSGHFRSSSRNVFVCPAFRNRWRYSCQSKNRSVSALASGLSSSRLILMRPCPVGVVISCHAMPYQPFTIRRLQPRAASRPNGGR